MLECCYRGKDTNRKLGKSAIYVCQRFDQCVLEAGDNKIPSCKKCKERLELTDPKFAEKWIDPLKIQDRRKQKTDALRNMLAGASVFLMGGGPSANDVNLEQLNRRGVWTLCINNVAGHSAFRPQAFVCADPPKKFSSSIWLDPQIMKFVPTPKLRGRRGKLRRKVDGEFQDLDVSVKDCPNVWGFQRYSYLVPDDSFFLEDGAHWGNHNSGVEKTGEQKTVCTMLLPMRLLRYLGARRVYLLGVDFRMSTDKGYSFPQGRTEDAVVSNNAQFRIVNDWLVRMQNDGVFKRFGIEFYNCFANSGLRAFPYVPFNEAVKDCQGIVEDVPSLENWYEK